MTRAERTFITRCTLVVRPIDSWTGLAPGASSIQVSLAETDRKPLRTSDGSYAFLDYSGKTCTLIITSSTYLEYREEILLPDNDTPPIVTISLLPNSMYTPPSAATGLKVKVCNELGVPLVGVQVLAYIDDEAAVRGRLAEEIDGGNGECIRISPGSGKLMLGDVVVLRDRVNQAIEWTTIVDVQADPSNLVLEHPLANRWNRGTGLLPGVRTASDDHGVAMIPFRGLLLSECSVHVEISTDDRAYSANWTAVGGQVTCMAAIQL